MTGKGEEGSGVGGEKGEEGSARVEDLVDKEEMVEL